ncbi:SPJ_0845 family protein [Enterococcus sp. LJL99]
MGLKFERSDDLDKLFDSFAVDPKKVEMPKEELEKEAEKEKKREKDSESK